MASTALIMRYEGIGKRLTLAVKSAGVRSTSLGGFVGPLEAVREERAACSHTHTGRYRSHAPCIPEQSAQV